MSRAAAGGEGVGRDRGSRAFAALAAAATLGFAAGAPEPAGACPEPGHRLETFTLFAPALGRAKRLLVYLPPGYACAPGRRFPSFYFNDGHDLFDWNPFAAELDPAVAADIAARDAWYGSWRLESQLDRAIAAGRLPPLIVVGIASDDGRRSTDLAPVPWSGSGEAEGIGYGRFVAEAVVPAVDARFRALPDRRCRGMGGASLGGVSALQIGLAHADRFGLVLAFSPVLGDPGIGRYLAGAWRAAVPPGPSTFLVDFDDDMIGAADRRRFAELTGQARHPGRQVILAQTPQGRHAIGSWAERVIPALEHLLRAGCPTAPAPVSSGQGGPWTSGR